MNKKELLKKFKQKNKIKKTILYFKSNKEIKKEMIYYIKNNYINNITHKSLTEEEINQHFKETEKMFLFGNIWKFKNNEEKETIIKSLNYDIKTSSIKEYDKIKGNWFKTEYNLYSL